VVEGLALGREHLHHALAKPLVQELERAMSRRPRRPCARPRAARGAAPRRARSIRCRSPGPRRPAHASPSLDARDERQHLEHL
jgi:hypothetical protein